MPLLGSIPGKALPRTAAPTDGPLAWGSMALGCLLIGAMSLLVPPVLYAAPVRIASRAGLHIVDFLPRDADRRAIRESIARALGRPISLVEPSSLLIEAARWSASDHARALCETRRLETTEVIRTAEWIPPPTETESLFEALIHQAGEQLAFLDLQGVLDSTVRARDGLVCENGLVSRDSLTRLFVYEALAHVYLEDGQAPAVFQNLLGIDPAFRLEEKYRSDKADRAFAEAKADYRRADVVLGKGGLEGILHLDGRIVTEPQTGLHASEGEHFVQLENRLGEVRSRWVIVPSPDGIDRTGGGTPGHGGGVVSSARGRVELSSLADFELLSQADAMWRLRKGVGPGPLDRDLARALDAYLDHSGKMEILFAVSATDDRARIRRLERGGVLTDLNLGATDLELPEEFLSELSPGTDKTGSSLHMSLGFGVQTLQGGQYTFAASGKEAGYVLEAGWSKTYLVTVRAALYPHLRRDGDAGSLCDGPGLSTEAEPVVAAVACLPRSPVVAGGLGVGYPLRLPHDLLFIPVLYAEVARIPSALVNTGTSDDSDYLVGNALMAGTMARGRLAYEITKSRLEVRAGLEASFGLLLARGAGESIFAVPLGMTVFTGVSF